MVHLSENEGIEGQTFVVIGGAGFVGVSLCLELVRRGAAKVRSFDVCTSTERLSKLRSHGVECIIGDIRKREDVERVLKNTNCVFHMASYGMSGKEMLQARQIDEINLDGTMNVLGSCVKCGVQRLVYVSTYNVVFGGKEIVNGNEALDYYPLEDHVDFYSRSKALAEQLVLRTNNQTLSGKGGKKLYTCALRPAAIYGPGEEHHLPRILYLAKRGILLFRVGGLDTKQDWIYVDNLVQALLLASMGLLDDIPNMGNKARAAGQAYFVSDGAPINTFKFLRPIVEEMGYRFPERDVSVKTALSLAWGVWAFYCLLYPWLQKSWLPRPFILPAEVYKVGVTHYFSIMKARLDLGYVPIVATQEGVRRTILHLKDKPEQVDIVVPLWVWVSIPPLLFATGVAGFVPLHLHGPFKWTTQLALIIFRSVFVVKLVFFASCLVHIAEGLYAWQLARSVDPENAGWWFRQTLALGYPSLRLLFRRI